LAQFAQLSNEIGDWYNALLKRAHKNIPKLTPAQEPALHKSYTRRRDARRNRPYTNHIPAAATRVCDMNQNNPTF
jgi:hypothetical protein